MYDNKGDDPNHDEVEEKVQRHLIYSLCFFRDDPGLIRSAASHCGGLIVKSSAQMTMSKFVVVFGRPLCRVFVACNADCARTDKLEVARARNECGQEQGDHPNQKAPEWTVKARWRRSDRGCCCSWRGVSALLCHWRCASAIVLTSAITPNEANAILYDDAWNLRYGSCRGGSWRQGRREQAARIRRARFMVAVKEFRLRPQSQR